MKEIYAMHGWGSDSSSWIQWERFFKANNEKTLVEELIELSDPNISSKTIFISN